MEPEDKSIDQTINDAYDSIESADVQEEPVFEEDSPPDQKSPDAVTDEYKIPGSWRDRRDVWDSLTPAAKAKVLIREQQIHDGHKMYEDGYKRWDSISRASRNYMPLLEAEGVALEQVIPNLLAAAHLLRAGTAAEKRALIKNWVDHFGVQLDDEAPEEYVDPTVAELKSRIDRDISGQLGSLRQQMNQIMSQSHEKEIREFASDEKNKYFDRVAPDIAKFIRSGAATTLSKAYDMAVWANEEIRKEMMDTHGSPSKEAAAAIKRGPSSIRGSGKPAGLSQKPSKSWESSIGDYYDQIVRQ